MIKYKDKGYDPIRHSQQQGLNGGRSFQAFIVTLLATSLLFGSCNGNQKQQVGDLPVIDITRNHPRKELRLQDIAVVEYIALETTDDVLLGESATLAHVSDQHIVVVDRLRGDIFVFNRSGSVLSHFNHRGQGPREYVLMSDVAFDENAGEIFVLDHHNTRIMVYSIRGEYQRTLRYPADLFVSISEMHNFDNGTLLVYDGVRLSNSGLIYNERPYLLLSKEDGSIVYTFDVSFPTRYINRTAERVTGAGREVLYVPVSISLSNNRHFGQDFLIADISSDTIYLLTQDRILTPLLARTPSVHASEPRRVLTSLLKTDRFILLQRTILDFAAASGTGRVEPPRILMYEFETGKIFEVSSFVDTDLGRTGWSELGRLFSPAIGSNMAAALIPIFAFEIAQERNRLCSELDPFVATLDEEDNPVVRIVTFK